jgi:hypothetical protein
VTSDNFEEGLAAADLSFMVASPQYVIVELQVTLLVCFLECLFLERQLLSAGNEFKEFLPVED